jgi:endonuclease-3
MRGEYALLERLYPRSLTTLDYTSAWQLLVATVLSAQTTDKRVNTVTPALFARYPTPADLGRADQKDVEAIIRSIGFFHVKAAHIIALSADIADRFDGQVPTDMKDLTSLPGVGRKTANVVLGDFFHKPGFPVDTHVRRVTSRLRWHSEWNRKNPDVVRIEKEVTPVFDPSCWADLSHRLIYLGREICHAQKPECEVCPLNATCPAARRIMKKRGTKPVASGEAAVDLLHAQGRGVPLETARR